MIKLIRLGQYKLIDTKHHTKILYLDDDNYAWIEPPNIGEILVVSHTSHKADHILIMGRYFLYDVENEPHLSDQQHLELEVGHDAWQGYLLPTGLPGGDKIRARMIATGEIITANPQYRRTGQYKTAETKKSRAVPA